jgi:hypothetical protein
MDSRNSALQVFKKKHDKPSDGNCYNCGKPGHFSRNCPIKKANYGKVKNHFKHKAKAASYKEESDSSFEEELEGALTATGIESKKHSWIVDSGASRHMTFDEDQLCNYRKFKKPEKVALGDGRTVEVVGSGDVPVSLRLDQGKLFKATMREVLHVPKLSYNLFSVCAAAAKGKVVQFGKSKCWIKDRHGSVIGIGSLDGKMYKLDCQRRNVKPKELASVAMQASVADLWHQRLGHASGRALKLMAENRLAVGLEGVNNLELSFCEACVQGKMHRKSHKLVG